MFITVARDPVWPENEARNGHWNFEWRGRTLIQFSDPVSRPQGDSAQFLFDRMLPRSVGGLMRKQVDAGGRGFVFPISCAPYGFNCPKQCAKM